MQCPRCHGANVRITGSTIRCLACSFHESIIDFRTSPQWQQFYEIEYGIPDKGGTVSPHPITHCQDCYHRRQDGYCSCRSISDMVLVNCPDWYPRE